MLRPYASLVAAVRSLLRPGPRMADEIECALSVALAIAIAHRIGAQNVYWAAFTGFVVMRGQLGDRVLRAVLRITGTIVGAGLALLAMPWVMPSRTAFALAAGLVATIALYGALTGKRSYAWLLAGLTFELILFDALAHPRLDAWQLARTRLLEVLAGTAACMIVSIVAGLTLHRWWPATPAPRSQRIGWHPHAFRHACQGGVAVMLLALLGALLVLPSPSQSCITILATMMVPVTTLGTTGFVPVSRRLVQRVAGCATGAAVAAAVLLAAHGAVPLLMAGTCLGVVIGRHIENGAARVAYVGTQFVLALLVVLVPDHYEAIDVGRALARLSGILIGMAVLEPVLLAWHLLGPRLIGPAGGDPAADA